MRRKVNFSTEDGTMLRGYVHSAGSDASLGIVTSHGFGGVKSHIDHYAALFAEAGLAMSLDDHRGFGTSDGAPRQEVDPYRQLADWRDAITFAESQPEFDAERGLGVWGAKALYSARGATTLEAM
jgi:alpha-beta hydrolase superfamily lysophospholipase